MNNLRIQKREEVGVEAAGYNLQEANIQQLEEESVIMKEDLDEKSCSCSAESSMSSESLSSDESVSKSVSFSDLSSKESKFYKRLSPVKIEIGKIESPTEKSSAENKLLNFHLEPIIEEADRDFEISH